MTISNKTRFKVLAPFLAIVSFFFLSIGIGERNTASQLKADGVEVPGQMVEGRVKSGRRGSKTYYATVTYQPQGRSPSRKEFEVSKSLHDRADTDQAVTVRYLPTNPQVAAIAGEESTGLGLLAIGGGMALAAVGMFYLGYLKKDHPVM